jgi:hypothetical protein
VHHTLVPLEVSVAHRFAVGETVWRPEPIPPGFDPAEHGLSTSDVDRSVWRIVEVGYTVLNGPWYRMAPVNDVARFITIDAHGRARVRADNPLGPVTEHVWTVDRQCHPCEE